MISDDTIVSEKSVAYIAEKFFDGLSGLENLPNGYTKLEYIQGNATTTSNGPYINTGIKVTGNTKITTVFQFVNVDAHAAANIFGVRGAASSYKNSMCFLWRGGDPDNTRGTYRHDYNGASTNLSGTVNIDTNRHTVITEKNVCNFDGTKYVGNMAAATFTQSLDLYLLANNTNGGLGECSNAKIFAFKVEDSVAGINANFIPCRRNSDGEIGMYEINGGKFYASANASSSRDFIPGPDVIVENPYEDEPANLSTVARLFELEKKDLYLDKPLSISRLKYFYDKNLANQNPYAGYTQLEYIEANGTQWIDTGLIPDQNTCVEFHCDVNTNSAKVAPMFGSRDSMPGTRSFVLWLYNGGYRFDYKSQQYHLTGITVTGRRYIFAGGYDRKFVCDQKIWNLGNFSFTAPQNLYIFGMMQNNGVDDRHPSGKIYLCNIFSSPGTDGMERRFVPAKRNSDGVSGLLDILDCTFYESLGEPWIAGPEVGPMPNFALRGYDIMEYARSSTETYIDTEFTPNQDSRVTMEMQKVANTTTIAQYIFCSRYYGMPEYGILKPANDSRWRDGYAQDRVFLGNGETGASLTQRMIIDKNKNVTYIGHGTVNHTYTAFTTPNTMALYGCFENGDGSKNYDIDMKLYWCRIYDNGTLIRNYYPTKRQSDNVVGLYDFVNNEFVTPIQGTLTAGSTIPISIS